MNPEEERFKIKLFAGAERWRPAEAEGSTFADLIALGQAAAAIKGNTAAAEEIANRLEGKVAVEVNVVATGSLGERIQAARARLQRRSASEDDAKETAEGDGADSKPQVLNLRAVSFCGPAALMPDEHLQQLPRAAFKDKAGAAGFAAHFAMRCASR